MATKPPTSVWSFYTFWESLKFEVVPWFFVGFGQRKWGFNEWSIEMGFSDNGGCTPTNSVKLFWENHDEQVHGMTCTIYIRITHFQAVKGCAQPLRCTRHMSRGSLDMWLCSLVWVGRENLNVNEWIDMKESKRMNWHDWVEMNKWMNWHE